MTPLALPQHHVAVVLSRSSLSTHGKSFALAGRFLPRTVCDDAAVIYAFCRRADDAVDLSPIAEQPRRAVELRRELQSIYAGDLQRDPVLGAFQRLVRERKIPEEYPSDLLAGIEADARGAVYPDLDALVGYCFRVAGTVGLMMSHVLGVRHVAALRHAAHLGIAMQLTNISRDVHEDYRRGRVYLPLSLLAAHGATLSPGACSTLPASARAPVAAVTLALLDRADGFYASGDRGIPDLPFRAALSIRAARLIYSDIGRVIRRRGADPFAPRAVVSTARKVLLAARAALETIPMAGRRFEAATLSLPTHCSDVVRL